jgi:hypothetical protein
MALTWLRGASCVLAALLVAPIPSSAFDTSLSDTAVREAYFLGQRHDETIDRFLDKYTAHLPPPKEGPYIDTVSFLSPFAQAVLNSSRHFNGYSAQQAQLDRRGQIETVKVVIDVLLTDSYGSYLAPPTGSNTPYAFGLVSRPVDFWKDFQMQFFNGKKSLRPLISSGQPKLQCGKYGCTLVGATLEFEFLAETFPAQSTTVQIDPPVGQRVVVDYDLSYVR